MRLIKSISAMRRLVKKIKNQGMSIGFVPTMGYLHDGHISLARQAKKDTDIVVMSIYVNPVQFGPKEDFKKYPRNLKRDVELARRNGVDIIFSPPDKQMYGRDHLTYIDVGCLSRKLCGKNRPTHFKGVSTVVNKLFNIVPADIAYFGQKDAQQARIIEKMVEDLNIDLKIKTLPIVREKDGLAMSSRNIYLTQAERKEALCLYKALNLAKVMIKEGKRDAGEIISKMKKNIEISRHSRVDYIEVVDARTLERKEKIEGRTLIALAVWIGKTRLIDNVIINIKKPE